jgi:hypothetical protein
MKVRNAIKKVKAHFKKQGIDIQINAPAKNGSYKWSFEHNGYEGSFSVNGIHGHDPAALDGDACLYHVRGVNDHSDLQSDYFAGSFRDNITQVCCSLLPNPPKFKAGQLVQGKDNKRAARWGFSGKTGLVMGAGDGYVAVRWIGCVVDTRGDDSRKAFSERDLTLLS